MRVDEREIKALLLQAVALAALADAIIHRCEGLLDDADDRASEQQPSGTVDASRRTSGAQSAGGAADAGEDLIASRVVFNKQKPSPPPTVPEQP